MSPSPTGAPPLGRKQRLLLEVERFARRRYGWVFAASLIAVVVASRLGSRLTLESDTLRHVGLHHAPAQVVGGEMKLPALEPEVEDQVTEHQT